jgi:hypothetical protein
MIKTNNKKMLTNTSMMEVKPSYPLIMYVTDYFFDPI